MEKVSRSLWARTFRNPQEDFPFSCVKFQVSTVDPRYLDFSYLE